MNRREFCHKLSVVGGTIALTPLIKACTYGETELTNIATIDKTRQINSTITRAETPKVATMADPTAELDLTATPVADGISQTQLTPTPLKTTEVAQIALVSTADRAYGVKRAIELLGQKPARGNRVLLKPNFNSADRAPGSTHPDVLRTLITEIYDMGARGITVGDRSGMGNTRNVMKQLGVLDMATELGFDTLVFDELSDNDWVIRQKPDFHWSGGFAVPKSLLDAECVVQTCNLKTHSFGGHFTLSLKNSVGFSAKTTGNGHDYMRELHGSPYQRLMIAEINQAYTPDLIVMDGVEAFVTGGPAKGKVVSPNVVLAGTDRVAMDAIGVAILRLFGTTKEVSKGKIFEQEQIARSVELGLGIDAPQKIRFLTDDLESERYAAQVQQLLFL